MTMNRRRFNSGLLCMVGAMLFSPDQSGSQQFVNGERLNRHLRALAEFGSNSQGGVSRVAYSAADRQGREYVIGLMRAAKLNVSIDHAGNIIGRRAGSDPNLPPLVVGSHIDSVPEGGNYDGDIGSLGAVEVTQTLGENDLMTRHPIEVIIFQNEEGGLFGSRAITGSLSDKELDLVNHSGKTVREGIKFIGGDPSKLADARRDRADIACYLELHIEQGGILDAEKVNIGVVEGIVEIGQWEVTIEGFANHAGTTAMNQRRGGRYG